MTTEADLLRAIRDEPEDNDVRLVYADWLEDHDRLARAEFIRLQIARDGRDPDDPEAHSLWQRELELRTPGEKIWRAELPPLPEDLTWGAFHRGFVEGVMATRAVNLLSQADCILDAIPMRSLHLNSWQPGWSLAGSRLLAATRDLTLMSGNNRARNDGDDPLLREILAWPEVRTLTHLHLVFFTLSTAGTAVLASSELPSLVAFSDDRLAYDERDLQPLGEAPWLGQLTSFTLKNHPLSLDLLGAICARLDGQRLRSLTLERARLDDEAALLLARSGLLAHLERLNLTGNALGPAGFQALLAELPPTARLLCSDNPLGDDGLRLLAASPLLRRLSSLPNVSNATDVGTTALADSPHARNIRTVYLPRRSLTSVTGQALFTSPQMESLAAVNLLSNRFDSLPACQHPGLRSLFLGNNHLTDAGLAPFCSDSSLPTLRLLYLNGNRLTATTCQALATSHAFPNLADLSLSGNRIGDAGGIALFEGPGLHALETLKVKNCGLGDATLRAWSDSLALRQLKTLELESEGNPINPDVYLAFCETAYRFGCDVDGWSRHPRLRPIRRPADGSTLGADERAMLVTWIQQLWFAEYHTMGWLKATTLASLEKRERLQPILHRYATMPTDDATRRAVIAPFLANWLTETIPESINIWNINPESLREISRTEMLALVDRIVEASERDGEEAKGRQPRYVIGPDAPAPEVVVTGEEPRDVISYRQIATWFTEELFDLNEVAYFTSPDQVDPVIIALDRDVIAIFWLE